MGVDYSAHAIIGVKLPLERLYRIRPVRACPHDIPDDAAYCPKCGRTARQLESAAIFNEDRNTLDGLTVLIPVESDYAIIGMMHCETGEYDEPKHVALPPSLVDIYAVIERVLRQYELWDDQPIVLYAVLEAS